MKKTMLEYVRSRDFLSDSPTYLKMDVVAHLLFFIQVSEKNNEPIPRKLTDRRKHGQKDFIFIPKYFRLNDLLRKNYFHRLQPHQMTPITRWKCPKTFDFGFKTMPPSFLANPH